jgi:hypothetical protein
VIWLYELPTWLLGIFVIVICMALGISGVLITRPVAKTRWHSHNDLIGFFNASVGVIYAVLLAMIAVATWEGFATVERICASEAHAVGALYRELYAYPEPFRADMQGRLATYAKDTVERQWPLMEKGEVELESRVAVDDIFKKMGGFEPKTDGQKIMHAQALSTLNEFVEGRTRRRQSVSMGLPSVMWVVVLGGAFINILLAVLYYTENIRLHLILTSCVSISIGLLIFLILAMDHPLLGHTSVGPDAMELVIETVIVPAH